MTVRRRYRDFIFDSARWDAFSARDGDIIISTPPKCGTTWTQMLCALLVFRTPDLPAPLAVLSPWLDMLTRPLDGVIADLEAQTHRRFVKTHTPLDGLPDDERITYVHVARDPRDVALSWDNHIANMDMEHLVGIRLAVAGADDLEELGVTDIPERPDDASERFWQWIDGDGLAAGTSGLATMTHHVETFWARRDEPNVHLFHYGDLRRDLSGQMTRLARALGVDPPTDELVAAATFQAMKARADDLAPNVDTALWHENAQFFDKARLGGWRELLDDEGEQRYEKRIAELVPQDLATWLHEGWLGAPLP